MTEYKVRVGRSGISGRGVFATQDILRGRLIEICPTLELSETAAHEAIYGFCFDWSDWGQGARLALGFGSLYNHSYSPNVVYKSFSETEEIRYYAFKDIKKGQELTINYNGDPKCQDSLWFEVE